MKAFIHAFQGKPWNEDCEAAYNGFKKLDVECKLFTTNEELDNRTSGDIVVGGMLMMEHVLAQANIVPPNFNYPEELTGYLGRNIRVIKIKDLKKASLPVFIKPVKEKTAKGCVVTSWNDIGEYDYLSPEADILCSDVINFVSEWRCFIRYGEILDIRFYNGDCDLKCDRAIVEAAVNNYPGMPAACSLDFGVTDDGRTLLIEMNDGFSIGNYGLNDELYAKFLTARWSELMRTIDPFSIIDRKLREGGDNENNHDKSYKPYSAKRWTDIPKPIVSKGTRKYTEEEKKKYH